LNTQTSLSFWQAHFPINQTSERRRVFAAFPKELPPRLINLISLTQIGNLLNDIIYKDIADKTEFKINLPLDKVFPFPCEPHVYLIQQRPPIFMM